MAFIYIHSVPLFFYEAMITKTFLINVWLLKIIFTVHSKYLWKILFWGESRIDWKIFLIELCTQCAWSVTISPLSFS